MATAKYCKLIEVLKSRKTLAELGARPQTGHFKGQEPGEL